MASVHLARMDGPGGFQKWVAIKRIHPHLVEDQTFIHMFLDEARIAARISHSNVATVFDLGEHEDTYWIAMEYLHGEPLREVMRRTEELGQPMPPEIACRVIADAAEGLHAAHELLGKNGEKLQLVHRDVTPHNLFVTYDGTTKVVDFGIAKFSSRMSSDARRHAQGQARVHVARSRCAARRSIGATDIFALGVVLWELTTGQRLFRMESDLDTLAKVQECIVPQPSTIVRGYPIELENIVMKALAKSKQRALPDRARVLPRAAALLMRRALFIASDEVAAYMQQIFTDRIQKREAHLRWAAEVTQTINLEGMLSRPSDAIESSIRTYNSEVQPSPATGRNQAVRPAAGMPADALPARPPTTTNATAPTNPRGVPAVDPADTLRPPSKMVQKPTPAARLRRRRPDVASVAEGAHGDDGGARHHRAAEPRRPRGRRRQRRHDRHVNQGRRPGVRVDGPIIATPIPAAGKPASLPPPAPQSMRYGAGENIAFAAPPRSVPPRAPSAPPLPPVVVAPTGAPMFPPPSNRPPAGDDARSAHVDALLAEALREQRQQSNPSRPSLGGIDESLRVPPGAAARYPTVPRLFAPPMPDMKTDTARSLKRPPPMWMVMVGSGLVTLLTAGVLIVIASALTSRPAPQAVSAPGASATSAPASAAMSTAAAPTATHAASVTTTSAGPFGAARAAFAKAIATPSPSTTAPAPPATGAASAAAPPPSASSASASPPPSAPPPAPAGAAPVAPTPTPPPRPPPPRPPPRRARRPPRAAHRRRSRS